MAWDFDGNILSFERRLDGFVESVTMSDSNGEVRIIKADCPNTFLRTLAELWAKYNPLKYIIAYNTKTQKTYSVFNPGWQKSKNGVIKGKMVNSRGIAMLDEMEIPEAEERVWIVVDFIRPED